MVNANRHDPPTLLPIFSSLSSLPHSSNGLLNALEVGRLDPFFARPRPGGNDSGPLDRQGEGLRPSSLRAFACSKSQEQQ